jgi:type IV pilus assembly protein PilW
MPMRRFPRMARRASAGFSLIELMIAMVIGLVVVGAVLSAYLGANVSGRNGRALSQITEDAGLALNALRSGISMVGYGNPTGIVNTTDRFSKAYTGSGIFGCDKPFNNPSQPIGNLTCSADAGSDAVAVAYEADRWNSVTNDTNVPLDCLGNSLTSSGTYYLNYSRYYVQNNQLFCRGPGNPAPAALVDNVVSLQVKYGVSVPTPGNPDTYRVARYSNAADMGAPSADNWTNTVSVRICVVIRSAENVLNQKTDYQGCAGPVVVDDDDRHLYKAFTSTIVLQNRVGPVL